MIFCYYIIYVQCGTIQQLCMFLYFFLPRYCNKVAKAVYTLIAALIHGTRDTFRKTFREIVLAVQNLF